MTHKLNRLTALVLAIVMVFSVLLVPASAASYNDVSENAWYKAAVDYVQEKGWMAGVSETSFAPKTEVTRGMMVTVLARVAGVEVDNDNAAFSDTPAGKWYTGAAAWAAENGIVSGVGGGKFAPNRAITRQDLCVMLDRYLEVMGIELEDTSDRGFSDLNRVAEYALPAMIRCAGKQLISGFEDSTIRPKDTATRAQVAQLMMRLDKLVNHVTEPMPAQSFDGEAGEDMSVSVNAPAGALPENTQMTVSRVTDEAALAAIQAKVSGELYAAADISFSKDETEIEPSAEVEVQIVMDGLEEIRNPSVVHVRNDGSVEYVAAELVSLDRAGNQKALRFRAKDFSIYAVVDDGEIDDHARMLVKFMDPGENLTDSADDTLIYSVYVTRTDIHNGKGENGADINLLPEIIEDPTAPDPTRSGRYPDRSFYGWAVVNGTTDEYNAESVDGEHDINRIRQQVYDKLDTGNIAEGDEFVVYAMIFNRFVVSYLDENQETVLKSTSYFTKEDSVDITIDYRATPYNVGKARFAGWQEDVGEQDIYDFGDDYTVTESVNFYALVEPGFYITFQENPDGAHKGASYRPPVFCENGVFTSADKPADPVLNGYIFDDWYRGEYDASYPSDKLVTNENFWDNPQVVLSKNENLYAKWHEDPDSSFTVIVWKQKVTGGTTKPDSYDYAGSVKIDDVATGTSLATTSQFSTYVGFAGQQNVTIGDKTADFLGFKYSTYTIQNAKDTNKVNCGGVTVVNVYYDRETVTLNFYPLTYTKRNSYTNNAVNFGKYNNNYYPLAYSYNGNIYTSYSRYYTLIYFYPVGSLNTSNSYYRYQNGTWYKVSYSGGRWYNSTLGTIDPDNQRLYAYEAVSDASDLVLVPTTATLSASTTYYVSASELVEGASGTYYIVYDSGYWYVYDFSDNYIGYLTTSQMNTLKSNSKLYTYENITIETYYTITVPSSPTTTMQGLYGSTLAENNKTWPETHWWFDSRDEFGRATGTRTTVLDAFIPASTSMTVNYYGETSTGDAHIYFQKQGTSGGENDYTTANSPSVSGKGTFYLSDKYNGFTCYQYKNGTNGEWITVGKLMHPSDDDDDLYYDADPDTDGFQAVNQDGDIWVRFKRNQYTVQYMYGAFYDYKGTTRLTDMNMSGVLNVSSPVYYQASISKFDKSYTGNDKEYYDPTNDLDVSVRDNYYFVGWYENPECTGNPYVFTGKEMPLDGKILYAKFAQRGVRVFLHPNAVAGTGDGQYSFTQTEQGMNFAKAYGEAVNDGQEIGISRKGYDFVGWYYDEDMTLPYIFDTKMAANMKEALAYGETEKQNPAYYTDPGTNSDIDRPQVDQMIHLYARWRAHLDGAAGIHVHYEANENAVNTGHFGTPGDHVWDDNMVYVDGVKAIARTASTPTNHEDMQFLYWEILDADGNSYSPKKIVYPGLEFDVLKNLANAQAQNVSSGDTAPNEPKMTQTTRFLENSLRPMTSVGPFNPLALDPVVSTTTWDFESDPTDWTIIDNDGDGHNWYWHENTGDTYYSTHGGNGVLSSASYDNDTKTALTPDNWAITPKITVDQYGTTVMTFWMASQQAIYPEKVDVYISETGNTVADFNLSEPVCSIPQTSATYTQYTIPLTEYAGKDVYVGFRHHDVTDMFVVKLDDVVVTNTKQKYTVTFKNWNGDTLQTLEVVEGQAATYTESTPTRENWTFVGWDYTAEELNCITSDLEVTAQFEYANADKWLVTFITTDGSFNETVAVDKNTIIPADQIPTAPAKEGYVFYAWNKQAELEKPITSNLVVTAIYHRQETTVYTMNLRAVYGEKQKQPPTHITWYANNGVSNTMDVITHDDTTDMDVTTQITVSDYVRSSVERVVNGETIQTQDLTTNEAVEIMPADTFENPGYTFLGWARLDEAENQTKLQQTISEDDLFLKWCPDETYTVTENGVEVEKTGCFKARIPDGGTNAEWKRVTKVAANELRPYHGLFAVWKRDVFYVLHSSDGKLEAVSMPVDNENGASVGLSYKVGTANLQSYVRPGYLYGGYYTDKNNDGYAYGYVRHEAVQAVANGYNAAQLNGWSNVASTASASTAAVIGTNDLNTALASSGGFIEYNGASLYTNGTGKPYVKNTDGTYMMDSATGKIRIWPNVWNGGDAETADGTALRPVPGKVYYLKEVHPQYLTSRMMYTYDTADSNKLLDVWVVTLLDDGNYKKNTDGANNTGFYVNVNSVETDKTAANFHKYDHLSATFTLTQQASSTNPNQQAVSTTVKASDFGLEGGVVMVANMKDLAGTATTSFTMLPSWTTPDGVKVYNNGLTNTKNSVTTNGAELFTWARSFDGTEKMFVDVDGGQEIGNGWATAEAKIWVRFYKEAGNYDSNCSEWVLAEKTGDGDIRALAVPAGSWKYFRIARFDKDTTPVVDNFWNATQQLTIRSSSNNGSPFENFVTKFWNNGTANDWGQYPTYTPVIINPS